MTKTRQALALLADGSKTFKTIADELCLNETEARRVIGYLQMQGYIDSIPLSYTITPKGVERHQFKAKSSPEKLARVHKRNQALRAAASAEKTMSMARSAPNSVFALGAM